MFTGIIEGMGTIRRVVPGRGLRLFVEADFALVNTRIGDSIAVSGACLTVVSIQASTFSADVSPETCKRTTLGNLRSGARVNLERALTLSSRLDGHLVTGHIDSTGRVASLERQENALVFGFECSQQILRYFVEKGSVAIDGISLTVNSVTETGFGVTIIPHTAKVTTLGIRKKGDEVNIETDIIGKFVERFVSQRGPAEDKSSKKGLDMDFLARNGFV
ncbi:MAG: riboflavin synthase [Desulfatibacillaceae bacterium]|nr:riboflavin synthase [Desulfatibacillaceae bacterium]